MAADIARRRYPTEGGFSSIGEEISTTENLKKKRQLEKEDNSSLRRESTIVEKKGKCGGESEYTTDSLKKTSSALEFSPLSEEKLKQIYQQESYRPDSLNFEEESEESDEDDVLTKEDFKKTEAYKLTMEGLDGMMLGKPDRYVARLAP